AEPEDRVDGAARLDPVERQAGPLRELLPEQAAHEPLVEVELVGVHPRHRVHCIAHSYNGRQWPSRPGSSSSRRTAAHGPTTPCSTAPRRRPPPRPPTRTPPAPAAATAPAATP